MCCFLSLVQRVSYETSKPFAFQTAPDSKIHSVQTLFASWGVQFMALLNRPVHHNDIVLSSLRGVLNCTRIMPKGASLSDSQYKVFRSENSLCNITRI